MQQVQIQSFNLSAPSQVYISREHSRLFATLTPFLRWLIILRMRNQDITSRATGTFQTLLVKLSSHLLPATVPRACGDNPPAPNHSVGIARSLKLGSQSLAGGLRLPVVLPYVAVPATDLHL
jgi:hypothetical protein